MMPMKQPVTINSKVPVLIPGDTGVVGYTFTLFVTADDTTPLVVTAILTGDTGQGTFPATGKGAGYASWDNVPPGDYTLNTTDNGGHNPLMAHILVIGTGNILPSSVKMTIMS